MLLLSRAALAQLLPMKNVVEITEDFFRSFSPNEYTTPQRVVVQMPERRAVWLFMPAYSTAQSKVAVKIINEYLANPQYSLPKAFGMLVLFDLERGLPLALMDSVYITEARTGAMSGVATRYMAREDSTSVGLIGSGIQAWAQLEAMLAVRGVEEVHVFSPTKANRERFCERAAHELGIRATPYDSPRKAVEGRDIVITATNSEKPVLSGEWISRGAHVNSIGVLPNRRELDEETIRKASKIVADMREFVIKEAGDIIHAINSGIIGQSDIMELSAVVREGRSIRESRDEITLFKSVGFAAIDLFTASEAYRIARERGAGVEVEF